MLTARTKQQEVIHGLNIGADDYLAKPFDMEELLARVRSLLRRKSSDKQPLLTSGDITLDTNVQRVTKGKKTIDLAPKEYGLLEFLMRHKGMVQERPSILEHVWGSRDDLLFSQTVDVHVAYIRRKLGKKTIQTIPGRGYMIPAD
jgi:DNA-binding response OmpR family regulator